MDYGHIILHKNFKKYDRLNSEYKLDKQITELDNSENDLNTKEKLDLWLEKFSFLKSIVEPNLDEEDKRVAQKLEEQIRHCTTSQFKYQNLLEIVFGIGSYCLFKKKYDYIKYLWQYKQPQDSDSSWIGHDIVPETLDKVIKIYFSKDHFDRKSGFWEDHHGSSKYYKKYFLLLLVRILSNIRRDSDGKYSQIENYRLPDLHVYKLSNLEHSIPKLIELVPELKKNNNMITEIGFDEKNIEEIFSLKLIPFLNKLKNEAVKQISAKHKEEKISQKKVAEFKKEVLKEFQKNGHLRDIFAKFFKTYKNKIEEGISDKENRFGIEIVDDKAAFFDEWHVSYSGWGGSYGRDLISGEDSYLLDEIAKDCKEIAKEEFEATLAKFSDTNDIVIFATNLVFWKFFQNSTNFKPEWHRDCNKLEIKGISGWYDFKGKSIPVFNTYHKTIRNQILILNKSRIGSLEQFSPLVKNEKKDLVEDILYMDVQALSENEELMKKLINNPPEWLKKIGDQKEQREHLKGKVYIKILERFKYNKPSDFEGYKLLLKENG